MVVLDGDINRVGWELREATEETNQQITDVVLPRAERLMSAAKMLADVIQLGEGRENDLLYLIQANYGRLLRIGGVNDNEVDEDGVTRQILLRTGDSHPEVSSELGVAQKDFLSAALAVFGTNRQMNNGKVRDTGWRLIRYDPESDLSHITANGNLSSGHWDVLPQDTEVTSVQLTPMPSEWEIRYWDASIQDYKKIYLTQRLGQVVAIRSYIHVVWTQEDYWKTPWHNVKNKSSEPRISFMQILYPGPLPQERGAPVSPLLKRRPWGMRRFSVGKK